MHYTYNELKQLLEDCCGHEKLKSGGQKLTELRRKQKEVKADIKEIQQTIEKLKDGKEWTPEKFAAIATKQQKEIERLKKQLDDCLGCEDYEDLFDDDETSESNKHAPNKGLGSNNSPS